jgi:hypothetical protein
VFSSVLRVVVCVCVVRLSSGMHRVELLVESNDSNYLYIGVVGRGWSSNSSALNASGAWSLQADGYVYDNGTGSSTGSSYRSGDRVRGL